MKRADFEVIRVSDDSIYIVDLDLGNVSVTNDVENVVKSISEAFDGIGKRRLFYQDSMGRVDEILVKDERFAGFKAVKGKLI